MPESSLIETVYNQHVYQFVPGEPRYFLWGLNDLNPAQLTLFWAQKTMQSGDDKQLPWAVISLENMKMQHQMDCAWKYPCQCICQHSNHCRGLLYLHNLHVYMCNLVCKKQAHVSKFVPLTSLFSASTAGGGQFNLLGVIEVGTLAQLIAKRGSQERGDWSTCFFFGSDLQSCREQGDMIYWPGSWKLEPLQRWYQTNARKGCKRLFTGIDCSKTKERMIEKREWWIDVFKGVRVSWEDALLSYGFPCSSVPSCLIKGHIFQVFSDSVTYFHSLLSLIKLNTGWHHKWEILWPSTPGKILSFNLLQAS